MKKILLLDNFDSFTYNLYQQVQYLFDGIVEIHRNTEISIQNIEENDYNAIIISPGPKRPKNAGLSNDIIQQFIGKLPFLGICLGMQCINEVFGGITSLSNFPVHGKVTKIKHDSTGLFNGIENDFNVARYHSLKIDKIPNELIVCAETTDKIAMAIRHKTFPIFGLQFHPESFLTENGDKLIKNFLEYV